MSTTTEFDTTDLSGVMRKVTALLANADDPATTPEAAESYRAKADALMFKYKIDSLTAPEQKGIARPGAVWTTIWVCRSNNEWSAHYHGVATAILAHNDVRYKILYQRNEEDGHTWITLHAVGLASDVQYSEALIASAIIAFGKRLEPKVEDESFAANCLRMRQGGMERKRIAALLLGPWETENEMKAKNRKVSNAIKEEAARIGEPHLADELLGRGTNIATYRKSYASGFYYTLLNRIQVRRSAAQMEASGLVLASAKDIVDEAFYEEYPDRRPKAVVESSATKQESCKRCEQAKSGYCREHSWMKPRAYRQTAYSEAGQRAGSHAARTVDLGTVGTPKVGGADRPAIG